jgi:CheY-like chemotaxis protein
MPDDLDSFGMTQTPTAERPLLGLTVLVVEDSRCACEAMRLLCLRSGARIRRADSLKSARRHLSVYRPAVAIVDLGLPDGSGADLIRELAVTNPRVGVIFGTSGDAGGNRLARDAGADGFMEKPVDSVAAFQQMVLSHLPSNAQPRGLRQVANDGVDLDPIALRDDLAHISDILTTTRMDERTISYVAQFLIGVARLAHDEPLASAATTLSAAWRDGRATGQAIAQIGGMIQERLVDQRQVI